MGDDVLKIAGPAGITAIAIVWLYLKSRQPNQLEVYHTENTQTLAEIKKTVECIETDVHRFDARLAGLEKWATMHEGHDDERQRAHEANHRAMTEENQMTRKAVHDLRNEAFQLQLRMFNSKGNS